MKKFLFFLIFMTAALAAGMAQNSDDFIKEKKIKMKTYIKNHKKIRHPEKKNGEIFMFNISRIYHREGTDIIMDSVRSLTINYDPIPFETKRLGEKAYSRANGRLEKGLVPVFVKKKELKEIYK
jgi:hypothetical protein